MEQEDLRRWESQCVQEEAAQCVAACPLHVDAKGFCALMAQRRWDKAWQTLAKTLPLPGVLARLCDAPCRDACVRKDAGGAIEVGALERFCAENAKSVAPPKPLPSRGKKVAVLGDGMSALSGAWEMARRGFELTLYSIDPGGPIRESAGELLPEGVLEKELGNLENMVLNMETGTEITASLLETLLEEVDAVFVDGDSVDPETLGVGQPDALTLGTQRTGLFVSPSGERSIILQAAFGRRAANSIERFTQGVSMVTKRELEGPYETRLFTSLENVESTEPVSIDAELTARDEAKRCLQCECMECVKGCEYLRHYKYYPKIFVRQIYNNESIVMGTRQANTMINSCMLCGQCETICPEDFSMAEVCMEARRSMVKRDKMPPSAHEFALRDMAFADGDLCALFRHAPGRESSEYVYFPGCQLTASNPDSVKSVYADLVSRLGDVGLMLHCCGIPAEWAGQEALYAEKLEVLAGHWRDMGSPKIIASCPTCLKTLREGLPDAEIVSHWSILRALGLPEGALVQDQAMAVNDPCAARHDVMLREDVRSLLEDLAVSVMEPEFTGERTHCCGYGGLLSNVDPDLGQAVALARTTGVEADFVTYCAMCRDMLAKAGKRALHIYDLLFPGTGDPGARSAPGHSARRENRVRLKEALLRDVWQESIVDAGQPHEAVKVAFTAEAAEKMEDRHILKSDVQKVLLQVERSGRFLINDTRPHKLASYRPVVVTYWVEFEQREDDFLVHNVWSHRMRIKGGQP